MFRIEFWRATSHCNSQDVFGLQEPIFTLLEALSPALRMYAIVIYCLWKDQVSFFKQKVSVITFIKNYMVTVQNNLLFEINISLFLIDEKGFTALGQCSTTGKDRKSVV